MGVNIKGLWDKPNIYIKITNVLEDEYYYFVSFDLYKKRGGKLISHDSKMIDKEFVKDVDDGNLIKSLYPYIKTFFTSKFKIEDVIEETNS